MKQKGIILYAALALAAAVGIIALLWMRLDAVTEQRDEARAAVIAAKESMRIEHENFDKELAIARTQPAVAIGVRRLCHKISLPIATPRPDDKPGADAGAGLAEGLAADVIACQRNGQRLIGLQEWVRANSDD